MFVYLIRNNANGKVYVGKTIRNNLQTYFKHNLRNALNGQKDKNYLYSAIRKYGQESFSVDVICQPTSESLALALECWYINHFDSNNPDKGYNLTKGGDGVSGMKQSDFAKQRVSETQLGKKASEETRKILSSQRMGNKFRLGKEPWNKRKPWSEEIRKKMSESAKLRWKNISKEEMDSYKEIGKVNANLRWN